jgi:hypothetical protein
MQGKLKGNLKEAGDKPVDGKAVVEAKPKTKKLKKKK